jgi:hypothetical protein
VTAGVRFALTLTIVLAALLGLSLCGYNYWEPRETAQMPFELASASAQPVICTDAATRDKIKSVMLEALDTALQQHVVHMFEVWMKDDRGQPERARNGVVNGVNAYLKAGQGVASWAPPDCPG